MRFSFLTALAAVAAAVANAGFAAMEADSPYYNENGILQIGALEAANVTVAAGAQHDEILSYDDASYIAVQFSNFDLPEGDLVVVRSPDASVSYFYTGKGREQLGDFVSTFIPGNTALVQYYPASTASSSSAFTISGFFHGFPAKQDEALCGADNSRPAKCYQSGSSLYSSLPQAYTKSRAVARLLIGGSSLCTGWLVGSQGHLITNQHCITSASDATAIDVEFMAESSSCSVECKTQLGCAGTVVATTTTFITNDEDNDFAIVKLPTAAASSAPSTYGYLQLRASGPKLGEQIYIPQHPVGYAKRIASVVDSGAVATILSTGATSSCGSNQVGYNADTQGGSSGSPVLSATDNAVVALHHCGGCQNVAVDVRDVISSLKTKGISIANLTV
jgi:lysyl endopeptidase